MVVWNDLSNTQWLDYPSQSNILRRTYVNGFLDVSQNIVARKDIEGYGKIDLKKNINFGYDWRTYGQIIVGPAEGNDTYFGYSVAMDASGLTIVAGSVVEDYNGNTNSGAVYVYSYDANSSQWVQKGNTIPPVTTSQTNFGNVVDITDDGNRILITAPLYEYVLIRDYNASNNSWVQTAGIALPHGQDGGRISGSGNAFVITDSNHSFTYNGVNYTNVGDIEVWRNTSGNTWTQFLHRSGNTDNGYAFRGSSISYDGSLVATLQYSYTNTNTGTNTGLVRLHRWNGTDYNTNFDIYGSVNEKLGISSDFSKDGSVLAISSQTNTVKVFNISSSNTTTQKGSTLTFTDRSDNVRLSDDGNTLLVASQYFDANGLNNNGKAQIFEFVDGDWVQRGSTLYGRYNHSYLGGFHGGGLAISGDGSKFILGAGNAQVTTTLPQGYIECFEWKDEKGTYNVGEIGTELDTSLVGGLAFKTNNTTRMTIDYTHGRVGLGITNPQRELTIFKSDYPALQLTNTVSGTGINNGFELYQGGYDSYLINRENARMYFATNGSTRVTIDNRGFMGIGTTGPWVPMHVQATLDGNHSSNRITVPTMYTLMPGSGTGGTLRIYTGRWNNYTLGTNWGGQVNWFDAGSNNSQSQKHTSGIFRGNINTSGLFVYSDERIKFDIEELDDEEALDTLRSLKPCKYNYRDPHMIKQTKVIGFIAQEVNEVLPNAIDNVNNEIIPNIGINCEIKNDLIYLDSVNVTINDLSLNIDISNVPIELWDLSENRITHNIVEIVNETTIRIDYVYQDSDLAVLVDGSNNPMPSVVEGREEMLGLYVYGTEVDDFHILKKDMIFSVATAALQEVDRQLQVEKAKTATLEAQVADLLARVSALESG